MRFDIVTIFPHIFDSYFRESIIKRAVARKLVRIVVHDLRDFAEGKHRKVDDKPYGGGPGMVLKIEPIHRAVQFLKSKIKNQKSKLRRRIILLSAKGEKFNQQTAKRLSCYDQLILICGRYEGVDERAAQHVADEEISIGDFVLTGGELPAMVLVDAISRHVSGVLGREESLEEKRYEVGVPVYTRPEKVVIKGRARQVPKVLLSGDHKKIREWREKHRRKGY